ncbi:nucleoside-diphosphate-sugar epimerase [Cenarchaeum symbiosum A]|uniref:Nucleoside-diphosphate-sugar epimerase n=1 Tax=Cenarchaeum symbiosum (strain A) TaxID=414004 RepID=A0RYZ0_CENSY|nr:nucleoside-diphosphate-sugar epimerase [Cenarchaeum symbiosum A]
MCLSRGDPGAEGGEEGISTSYSISDAPKLRGCTAFVHLAEAGRPGISTDASLARDIVKLCRTAGIGRITYLSGLGASPSSTSAHFLSRYAAEQEIASSGLEYTIFRPSFILGTADRLTRGLKKQLKEGGAVIPGSGEYPVQPIHIDDACRIIRDSAISDAYLNSTVDLVGPRIVTYTEFLSGLKDRRTRRVELEEALRRAVTDHHYYFGPDDLAILVGGFVGDFEGLRARHKGKFTPYEEALKSSGLSQ